MRNPKRCILTGLAFAAALVSSKAGTFENNFDSGLPAGTAAYGNTVVEGTGGVANSGVLKLTKAINSQTAGFVIEDFDSGATVYGFDADFDVLLGPGNPPADGMSFCFGALPDGTWGENGPANTLAFVFQLYPYGGDDANKPNINVRMNGDRFVTHKYNVTGADGILTYPDYAHVHIGVNADGSMNMAFKGQIIFTNLFIPGYTPTAGRFGFGGRTGGANANQWVDNLKITTLLQPKAGISQQPRSQKVLTGQPAVLEARITNPENVTLQWFKGAAPVSGANTDTLTIPAVAAADAGTYRLVATGPNNVATSADAVVTVVNLMIPGTAQLTMNFDDGAVPANTTVIGSAIVNGFGGVNGSGSLQLVPPMNDQFGAFIINDPNAGAPVYGFTAKFDATAGGGSAPPADGFAFAFGTDIPDTPSGEVEAGAGLGSGLRVTFDIYNNDDLGVVNPAEGQQPAPSIDVRLGNQVLGSVQLPLSFMETAADTYGQTIVQLNTDGTINVVYRGVLVFDKLPVPNFISYSGGRFALAARTGGLNANISIDNLELTTDTTAGALRIATQPTAQTVLVGRPATFTVAVNDTAGTTYQWMRNNNPITGATDATYTTPATAMSDSGSLFKVQVTKGGAQVVSSEVALTVVNLTVPTAPTLALNFNDGAVPANTSVSGSASVVASGGVDNSGMLVLTPNQGSLAGGFLIQPLIGGAEVSALWASFDVHISEGSAIPADGLSFNFAPSVGATGSGPDASYADGLSVIFDTYDNGGGEAPAIDLRWKGQTVSSTKLPWSAIDTGAGFRTVLVRVDPTGLLDAAYGDRVLANGLQLPNYSFITAGKFGFFANTGGENENHWVDNINIQVTKSAAPLGFATQPADVIVLEGRTATFSVQLTDPVGATYQWSKNGQAINGATQSSYTTPAVTFAADNGAKYKVHAVGPGGAADSREALLTVIQPITIANPQILFDFNDGMTPNLPPPNETVPTILLGRGEDPNPPGGYIWGDGGVTNSGVLRLTDAVNGQGGTFIIPDFNNNQPVKAFTVYFAVRVGGGTATPADGFSVSWAPDIPDDVIFGENGNGSGLTVGFDIYNNSGEAPSFNVFYKGGIVATKMVNISALMTGDAFENVFIRLNPDGTLDVQYKGEVIFNKVALPNFSAAAGAKFAWGGRTGGLNANQWVDNIAIVTTIGEASVPIGWTVTGTALQLTWGAGWKLQSTSDLGNPNSWQDVLNATSPFTPPLTGPGTFYRLINAP